MALWKHCFLCLSDSSDNIGSLLLLSQFTLMLLVPQHYTLYLNMCQYNQYDLLRVFKNISFPLNIPNARLTVSLRSVLGLIYVIWPWGKKKAMNEHLNKYLRLGDVFVEETILLSDWKEPKARSFKPEISQHPPYYSTHCTFLWPTGYFCLLFMYLSVIYLIILINIQRFLSIFGLY